MFSIVAAEKANDPDLLIAAACRFFDVSTSGFYEWRHAQAEPCERRRTDATLHETIREIHRQSRGTYGSPPCMPNCGSGSVCGSAVNTSND